MVEVIDCAGRPDACPVATSLASAVGVARLLTLAWGNGGNANLETAPDDPRVPGVDQATTHRCNEPARTCGPAKRDARPSRRLDKASGGTDGEVFIYVSRSAVCLAPPGVARYLGNA